MKKEQMLIIVAVVAAILLVSNLMSFSKINKLNDELAQLNKAVQAKQVEVDEANKALESIEIKVTAVKPALVP